MTSGLTRQVWVNHNDRHTRYAYQLIERRQPVLRWDNAPHHPELTSNFPHHFHDASGRLMPSALTGDPLGDLRVVLSEIENYLF